MFSRDTTGNFFPNISHQWLSESAGAEPVDMKSQLYEDMIQNDKT